MAKIIDVKDLSYVYNRGTNKEIIALRGINLNVRNGEIVGIIGPSGSGKSTLLQHLNGLILPQEGDVLIEGVSIKNYRNLKDIRKMVGLLFQNPEDQIFERYVGDEIAYALFNFGFRKDKARERVKEVLNLIGYSFEFKNRLTTELSGGEKRLVSFLSVIAYEPDVLVLDEPTVGLDLFYKRRILELVKGWIKKGKSVVIVSHNMDEVFNICNRVYLLNDGLLVAHGEVDKILKDTSLLLKNGITPPGFIMLLSSLEREGIRIDKNITSEKDLEKYLIDLIYKLKKVS